MAVHDGQFGVSVRLVQVLRVYGRDLDPCALADLRAAIAAGRHDWFHDEFAGAIRSRGFTLDSWCETVATRPPLAGPDAGRTATLISDQQRVVWDAVFPGEPFPLAVGGRPRGPDPQPGRPRLPASLMYSAAVTSRARYRPATG